MLYTHSLLMHLTKYNITDRRASSDQSHGVNSELVSLIKDL